MLQQRAASAQQEMQRVFGAHQLASKHFQQFLTQHRERFAKPEPWTTLGATRFVEKHFRPDMKLLEFGGGGSTLWWAERVQAVTTIESGPDWAMYLLLAMMQRPELLRRWKLVMSPCTWRKRLDSGDVDTSRWLFWHHHKRVLSEPDKDRIEVGFWDNLDHDFDTLFIDSTNRWGMLRFWEDHEADLRHVRMVIVDNTESDVYARAMENFMPTDFECFHFDVNRGEQKVPNHVREWRSSVWLNPAFYPEMIGKGRRLDGSTTSSAPEALPEAVAAV